MIKHKYIEHLQELETIRNDSSMSLDIVERVNELQLIMTIKLKAIMEERERNE